MNNVGGKADKHFSFNYDFNKKKVKFKVDDHVRISKYKNIFAKIYLS